MKILIKNVFFISLAKESSFDITSRISRLTSDVILKPVIRHEIDFEISGTKILKIRRHSRFQNSYRHVEF